MLRYRMCLFSGPLTGLCKFILDMLFSDLCESIFSDRCRTTNNMLGDAYGAAVVAALSKKELVAMDELNEKIKEAEETKKKMQEKQVG